MYILAFPYIDTSLFTKTENIRLLIVQVYVDDIIFESPNEKMYEDLSNLMQSELEIKIRNFICKKNQL